MGSNQDNSNLQLKKLPVIDWWLLLYFKRSEKPSVYLLLHGIIQFISEGNSKKIIGRVGPEMGGPLQWTNEQLAMSCVAKTGE